MFSHILFTSDCADRPALSELRRPLPKVGYLSLRRAIVSHGPHRLLLHIFLWRLYCLTRAYPSFPRILAIRNDREIIHFSFVLPALKRFEASDIDQLEIGPCWTHPDFRRQGYMRYALDRIRHDYWRPRLRFCILCRSENTISRAAIANCGFRELWRCQRIRRRWLPIHFYQSSRDVSWVDTLCINSDESGLAEERLRFNERSRTISFQGITERLRVNGPAAVPLPLRAPYESFHQELRLLSKPRTKILDICCGDGLHSMTGALSGAEVYLVDVAEESLKVALLRADIAGVSVNIVHSRAETLPFPDQSIDVVTCAGGLSYVDIERFIAEAKRVLKSDGVFLCVDSFNRNWIYRFNRYLRYRRGERSYSTLERMPDEQSLARFREVFGEVQVEFFGLLVFCLPLLNLFCTKKVQALFLTWTDRLLSPLRRFSFKVVIRASRPFRIHNNE